jgi:hypothetical protein
VKKDVSFFLKKNADLTIQAEWDGLVGYHINEKLSWLKIKVITHA